MVVQETGDCRVYLRAVLQPVAVEMNAGTVVVLMPSGKSGVDGVQQLIGTLVGHQGATASVDYQSLHYPTRRCLKPHGGSVALHRHHIVVEAGSASSASHDHVLHLRYLAKHTSLQFTETSFASFGEYLAYGAVVTLFDVEIQVYETPADRIGQRTPERRLAACHVAHYEYGTMFRRIVSHFNSDSNQIKFLPIPQPTITIPAMMMAGMELSDA